MDLLYVEAACQYGVSTLSLEFRGDVQTGDRNSSMCR